MLCDADIPVSWRTRPRSFVALMSLYESNHLRFLHLAGDPARLSGTLVSRIELDMIDPSGTAIGDALGTAAARLRRSDARSKAVVLLTDGDSNAGSIAPEYGAHLAQTVGARVYTIQIGSGDDVDVQDGVDLFGQPKYVRAHFPVNPELLRRIAQTTGGDAYVATDAAALRQSMHDVLDKLVTLLSQDLDAPNTAVS